MNRSLHYSILLLIAVLFLASCSDENVGSDLDQELSIQLDEASNGQGKGFYMLPESHDYSHIPQDHRNPLTKEKVELGQQLYHETRLAVNAKLTKGLYTYSCASCHHAAGGFQACLPQGIADGGIGFGASGEGRTQQDGYDESMMDIQPIRTPSILNNAYQELQLWNGQFGAGGDNIGTESKWKAGTPIESNFLGYQGTEIQAIAGLSVHRMGIDTQFIFTSEYKEMFDAAFPNVNTSERYDVERAGLAIAAYERTVLSNRAPFQDWLRGDNSSLTENQKEGAILFFGKAGCYNCHNGPALNSMEFFALGMEDLERSGVFGPPVNDATKKGRGGFTGKEEDFYKFKTPQLYSLKYSPFYGHGASFTSVREVIEYKNEAVKENFEVDESYLDPLFQPLGLTDDEIDKIADFIVNGLDDKYLHRYEPSSIVSGACFPNNDLGSKIDLGCN